MQSFFVVFIQIEGEVAMGVIEEDSEVVEEVVTEVATEVAMEEKWEAGEWWCFIFSQKQLQWLICTNV